MESLKVILRCVPAPPAGRCFPSAAWLPSAVRSVGRASAQERAAAHLNIRTSGRKYIVYYAFNALASHKNDENK